MSEAQDTPGAGGAGDVGNRVDLEVIRERLRQHAEADGCAVHPAVLLRHIPELIAKVDRLIAERDALRAAVERLPHHHCCRSHHEGKGFEDCTCGIRAALARGPAAGETTDGGGKD
jgi:hypothetical protein